MKSPPEIAFSPLVNRHLPSSPDSVLGPDGRIAARLPSYEHRPQQLAMADSVERALVDGHHLVVEAGTGVGKSFAYLVPAISYVTAEPPPPPSDEDDEDHPFAEMLPKPR